MSYAVNMADSWRRTIADVDKILKGAKSPDLPVEQDTKLDPVITPHHTILDVGLIGGGHLPMPGEVSLAYHGRLCLVKLPECRRHVLEVLRQPLEEGIVTITSASMFT
jgi:magnesium chelatase family protein